MEEQLGGNFISLGTLVVQCLDALVLKAWDEDAIRQNPEVDEILRGRHFTLTILNLLVIDPVRKASEGLQRDGVVNYGLGLGLGESAIERSRVVRRMVTDKALVEDEEFLVAVRIQHANVDHLIRRVPEWVS